MARRTTNDKTIKYFREKGYFLWNVEKYNPFSGRKNDLYGIIDFLGITKKETIGVQSCGADVAPHIVKLFIYERKNTKRWLENENRSLVLVGWRKVKYARLSKKMIYKPRIFKIILKNGNLCLDKEHDVL